jgi:hypothetical protein
LENLDTNGRIILKMDLEYEERIRTGFISRDKKKMQNIGFDSISELS